MSSLADYKSHNLIGEMEKVHLPLPFSHKI